MLGLVTEPFLMHKVLEKFPLNEHESEITQLEAVLRIRITFHYIATELSCYEVRLYLPETLIVCNWNIAS